MPATTRQQPVRPSGACKRCGNTQAGYSVRSEACCGECYVKYIERTVARQFDALKRELRHSDSTASSPVMVAVRDASSVASRLAIQACVTRAASQHSAHYAPLFSHVHVAHSGDGDARELREYVEKLPGVSWHDLNPFEGVKVCRISLKEGALHLDQQTEDEQETDKHGFAQWHRCGLDETSLADMRDALVNVAMTQRADMLACRALLWPDTGTELASRIMSLTVLGRGRNLSVDASSLARVPGRDLWAFRPLCDVLDNELALYWSISGGMNIGPNGASREEASIDALTRDYFSQLEDSYPSLVSTVVRTTAKLQRRLSIQIRQSLCRLCGAVCDEQAADWLAARTVREPPKPDNVKDTRPHSTQVDGELICYGCRTSLRGLCEPMVWPLWAPV